MHSTYQQAQQAVKFHIGFTKQEFYETAEESVIYAVAKAEEYGVCTAVITLWLNTMHEYNQTQGA